MTDVVLEKKVDKMEAVIHHAKGLGSLFYLVDPYETSYEKVEDIPKPNWTTKVRWTRSRGRKWDVQ